MDTQTLLPTPLALCRSTPASVSLTPRPASAPPLLCWDRTVCPEVQKHQGCHLLGLVFQVEARWPCVAGTGGRWPCAAGTGGRWVLSWPEGPFFVYKMAQQVLCAWARTR